MNFARSSRGNVAKRVMTMQIGVLAKSCRTMLECCGAYGSSSRPDEGLGVSPHAQRMR
jgi:hypothetical protein